MTYGKIFSKKRIPPWNVPRTSGKVNFISKNGIILWRQNAAIVVPLEKFAKGSVEIAPILI